jgi:outer membrane biosynthesis protein TonB
MASQGLRKDEALGLGVAIALHLAVLGAILFSPRQGDVVKPPQRIEVTISDEIAKTSTSPDPNSQAAPDKSPELGEPAPEAAPEPAAEPAPAPEPAPPVVEKPKPQPRPEPPKPAPPKPAPKPVPKAPPKPVQKPVPKPVAKPVPKPAAKPAPKPAEKTPPRKASPIDGIVKSAPKSAPKAAPKSAPPGRTTGSSKTATPPKKAGSSAFDDAFKAGTPGAKPAAAASTGTPAAQIGPSARSALGAAISRQLKPHWQAPQGADVELLVTKVRFRLNRDGSLAGEPQAVGTTGQTAANQAQVARHQEQAIRAVKLAAPFDLPDDLYEGWKVVTTNFDRRLSQ